MSLLLLLNAREIVWFTYSGNTGRSFSYTSSGGSSYQGGTIFSYPHPTFP